MFLELRQKPILAQKLIMTPQLQQAIKLLQLSSLELVEKIQQELGENPTLEEVQESIVEKNIHDAIRWHNYLDSYSYQRKSGFDTEVKKTTGFETYTPAKESLAEHLFWQLLMISPTPEDEKIGSIIAGSLDDKGYLKSSTDELAELSNSAPCRVEQVLSLMQSFDPPGVCARDLKECLFIQACNLGRGGSLVTDIIANHLKDIEKKDYRAICRALKASMEEVILAVNVIKGLEPIPARQFSDSRTQYIVPDIFVYKMEGDFVIELNSGVVPRLRISPVYRKMLVNRHSPNETKDYLLKKMRSAEWLIKSIHQRERTIYRVMESILKFQRDFFEKGAFHLKPLVLRDVAEDIDMNESTVSRVATKKYVQTPHGVFSLKYFFNSFIRGSHGESIASRVVQEKIRKIIAGEDSRKPLSDDKIAKILNDSNINIARRTVAKYREVLKIPPSGKRKQFMI
jgi:RNA polymerase sigma-54 factor